MGIGKQSIKTDYNMVNVEFTKHIVNLSKKAKIKKFILQVVLVFHIKYFIGYFISKYKAEKLIINSGLELYNFSDLHILLEKMISLQNILKNK